MKRLVLAVVLALGLTAGVASAGMMCDAAAKFNYESWTLNGHCLIEWLWEIGTY